MGHDARRLVVTGKDGPTLPALRATAVAFSPPKPLQGLWRNIWSDVLPAQLCLDLSDLVPFYASFSYQAQSWNKPRRRPGSSG
jgi:hypothetical protein